MSIVLLYTNDSDLCKSFTSSLNEFYEHLKILCEFLLNVDSL